MLEKNGFSIEFLILFLIIIDFFICFMLVVD